MTAGARVMVVGDPVEYGTRYHSLSGTFEGVIASHVTRRKLEKSFVRRAAVGDAGRVGRLGRGSD